MPTKDNQLTQNHGAHSGSRSGISDYNDGANVSHYQGNEENRKQDLSGQPAFESSNQQVNTKIGKEAWGNELKEENDRAE